MVIVEDEELMVFIDLFDLQVNEKFICKSKDLHFRIFVMKIFPYAIVFFSEFSLLIIIF